MCRVYAGIHFLHDVTDGRIVGNQVSNILSVLHLPSYTCLCRCHVPSCTHASNMTFVRYASAQRLLSSCGRLPNLCIHLYFVLDASVDVVYTQQIASLPCSPEPANQACCVKVGDYVFDNFEAKWSGAPPTVASGGVVTA